MMFILDTSMNRTYIARIDPALKNDVIQFVESEHFIIYDFFHYTGPDEQNYVRVDILGVIPKDMQMRIKLAFG